MTTQHDLKPFAERLSRAVDESRTAEHGRHKLRRPSIPHFTQVANPTRVRSSEDLLVDRIRAALD